MDPFLQAFGFLKQNANTIALAITWAGIIAVYLRRKWQWRQKHFLNQVNFSLNYLVGQSLAMRTLLETTAEQVWLNEHGIRLVFAAAQKTTIEQPVILLKDAADQAFVNRAVGNRLSERFAESFVAAALGVPVRQATFCFAITCERYGEMRTIKLRVLVLEEKTLRECFGPAERAGEIQVSEPAHRDRLRTLRILHALQAKDQGVAAPVLGRVQLGVIGGMVDDPK